jgi:hypothetical protein
MLSWALATASRAWRRGRLAVAVAAVGLLAGVGVVTVASPAVAAGGYCDTVTSWGSLAPSPAVQTGNDYVGYQPTYDVSGPVNCPIFWSSYRYNPALGQYVSTGEYLSYYGHVTSPSGYWIGAGNAWTAADAGSWLKVATFGSASGPSAYVFFTVVFP